MAYVPPSSYDSLSYDPKHELHPIVQIQFGILSPGEVRARSVVEVTSSETYSNGQPVTNGLFDQRMGSLNIATLCETCNQLSTLCQGHSGHINFAKPVFNIKHMDIVKKVLKSVCYNCSHLLANVDLPEVRRALYEKSGARRLDAAVAKANSNKGICLCCKKKQPEKYTKPPDDGWVLTAIIPEDAAVAPVPAPVSTGGAGGAEAEPDADAESDDEEEDLPVLEALPEPASLQAAAAAGDDAPPPPALRVFEAGDVLKILERITDAHCDALGFNAKACRPDWLIQTVQLVPSPIMRPSTQNDTKQRSDDDLTSILGEIVKHNNALKEAIKGGNERHIKETHRLVQLYATSFIDNQPGSKVTVVSHTKRPMTGVCPRLRKKEGRMRNNLMGKRCDQTARAVITPDPLIGVNELGVPLRIAMNQTFGEVVNEYNIAFLSELVARGPDKYPGATSVKRNREGFTEMVALRFGGQSMTVELQPGDVVYRHLLDKDIILFNRQPSLHKMSLMGHRVRVMPHDTFRLNVCAASPYNADFDGDEMNTHNAQCIQTRSELNDLSSVAWLMINPKNGKPSIYPVQDCLLGLHRMTKDGVRIPRREFMNLMMKASRFGGRLPEPGAPGGRAFTGRQATSVCFSPTLHLDVPNDAFADGDDAATSQNFVVVRGGEHLRGALTRRVFDAASRSLMHATWADEGPQAAMRLINDVQRLANAWLRTDGFSVGVSDLVPREEVERTMRDNVDAMNRAIDDRIATMHIEGLNNHSTLPNNEYFEEQLKGVATTHDDATRAALMRVLGDDNRMMTPIRCKSKGDALNIQQMMTCVGQQWVDGTRIHADRNGRTMSHFPCFDRSAAARGYVTSSFIRGLRPTENFFHAIAGREGLIDTAVKSVTGDTPIVVVEGGVTKTVAIGDWIDAKLAAAPPEAVERHLLRRMELLHLDDDEPVRIPTTDEAGVVTWGQVTAVTRHDPGTELYKITTAGGRQVIVTESKSLLVWNQELGKFREELTPSIKVGDCVPVTARLGPPPAPPSPLTEVEGFPLDEVSGMCLGFGLTGRDHASDAAHILAFTGTEPAPAALDAFRRLARDEAGELRVPDFAFGAPEPFVKGACKGFCYQQPLLENASDPAATGFTVVNMDKVRFPASSARLAAGVAMLFSRVDIVATLADGAVGVRGPTVSRTQKKRTAANEHKAKAAAYVRTGFVAHNDVVLDPIVAIEVIDLTTEAGKAAYPKVYDLTVPSTLNFGLANGLQVRDTSETGYTQRQLVKALEDAQVVHDLTVRGASKAIVQFLAGDDGMDPSFVEVQAVPQLLADEPATLMARHLLTEADVAEVRAVVAAEALKRQPADWLDRCAGRFERMLEDRAFVASRVFNGAREKSVRYPIPFERILRRAAERARAAEEEAPKNKGGSGGARRLMTDLTPAAVLEAGDALVAELQVARRMPGVAMLGVLLRGYLCPKQVVLRLRLRAKHLAEVVSEIRDRFRLAYANPGDMVGIVAAQSIGETITQLTLNSFHTSGSQTAAKATQGVPRLKELLQCSRNPKTPFLTVYLQPDVASDQAKTLRVQRTLETTRVRNLLISSAIYFDPPVASRGSSAAEARRTTLLEEDRDLIARYDQTADLGGSACPTDLLNPWLVRLEFDREKLYLQGLTLMDVALRIQDKLRIDGEPGARCVFSDDVDDRLVMRVHANTDSDAKDDPVAAIKALEEGIVNTAVKGVPGVEKTAFSLRPYSRFDAVSSTWNSGEEYVIDTAGSNLREALAVPGVDRRRIVSSDVLEVAAVLGIEAARQALYNELSDLLRENPIAHRHLSLLVDMMTTRGSLMAITRHGINRNESGPLAHASFEEVDAVMFNAGRFGKVDNMAGISANIMVGQMPPSGTATSEIVLDEEVLAEVWPQGATINASFDRTHASASMPRRATRGAGYRLLDLAPPVGPAPQRAARAATYDVPDLHVVGGPPAAASAEAAPGSSAEEAAAKKKKPASRSRARGN